MNFNKKLSKITIILISIEILTLSYSKISFAVPTGETEAAQSSESVGSANPTSPLPDHEAFEREAKVRLKQLHKRQALERWKEVNTLPLLWATAAGVAGYAISQTPYLATLTENPYFGMIGIGGGMALAAPMANRAKDALWEGTQAALKSRDWLPTPAPDTSKARMLYEVEKLEEEFELRKLKGLSQQYIDALNSLFQSTRRFLKHYSSAYEGDVKHIKFQLEKIESVLALPEAKMKISTEGRRNAFKKLKEHLRTYEAPVHDNILKMLNSVVTRSNLNNSTSPDDNTTSPVGRTYFFKGAPGTGKTATAEAFAKALGLPFCRIGLTQISSVELLIGRSEVPSGKPMSVDSVMGAIAKCMTQPHVGKPARNPIIFIDEVHYVLNQNTPEARALKAELQKILEPSQRMIHDDGLGVDIDISGITLILNANEDIDSISGALTTRMIPIEFPPISRANKSVIAYRSFEALARDKEYSPVPEDFVIIDEILRHENEPGARCLNSLIADYIEHKKLTLEGELRGQYNIPERVRELCSNSNASSTPAGLSHTHLSSASCHLNPEELATLATEAARYRKLADILEKLVAPIPSDVEL